MFDTSHVLSNPLNCLYSMHAFTYIYIRGRGVRLRNSQSGGDEGGGDEELNTPGKEFPTFSMSELNGIKNKTR